MNSSNTINSFTYQDRKFQVVILDSVCDTIQHPLTQKLFPKIIELRTLGYKKEYEEGILPFDTADFVGVHLLVCEWVNQELIPLMCFKSISIEKCQHHKMAFPIFQMTTSSGQVEHEKAIQNLVTEAKQKNESIGYNGSWTIHPHIRENKELVKIFRDVTVALLVHYYRDYRIPNIVAAATLKFNVHKFKEWMGWEYLELEGKRLPEFQVANYFDVQAVIMHLRNFSTEAKELAATYQNAWNERITIDRNATLQLIQPNKKAA